MTTPRRFGNGHERGTHCIRDHAFAEHGWIDNRGQQVCQKCRDEDRKALASIREYVNRHTTALSQLAQRWDNEIRCYALERSAEAAVEEYGLEFKTVKRLIHGRRDNSQFSGREPKRTRAPARPRG